MAARGGLEERISRVLGGEALVLGVEVERIVPDYESRRLGIAAHRSPYARFYLLETDDVPTAL